MSNKMEDYPKTAIEQCGIKFTLRLENCSLQSGTFCLYQKLPYIETSDNQLQLAWLVKGCHPGGYVTFSWVSEYSLHWSQQGSLDSGVSFETGGFCKANLLKGERMNFTYEEPAYKFNGNAPRGGVGSIGVNIDDTVKIDECMIAIAVVNKPFAAVKAQPNSTITFTPNPEYYVSFGNFVQGAVVDASGFITPLKLEFNSKGITNLSYCLNTYNEWESRKFYRSSEPRRQPY